MKLLAYLALAGGLMLAGCSPITPKGNGDGGNDPDANTTDGGGGEVDAGPGMVTARALDLNGNPLPGINVAFSEPDGTLISMATTAAPGEATATVPPDAIVSFGYSTTVSQGARSEYLVQVIMGVQPGDTVETNLATSGGGESEPLGMANLMFSTLHAGASYYRVGHSCETYQPGPNEQTFSMTFSTNRCSGRTTTLDLLGIAWNSNDVPLAWTMFDDVQIGAANTFTSTGWNTNFAQFNAFYTNAPYDGDIELDVGLIRDDIDYAFGGFTDRVGPLTAGQNAAYVVPVPGAFTLSLHVGAQYTSTARDRLLIHQTKLMPTTTSNSVDLSGLGFPSISSVTLDTATPGRPAYRWTVDGAIPSTAQASIILSTWSDANSEWTVMVLAPADTPSPLRMPALPNTFLTDPGTLSPRWPPPAAVAPWQNVVGLFESGDHADYAAMRTERGLSGLIGNGQFLSTTAPIGTRSIVSVGGVFGN